MWHKIFAGVYFCGLAIFCVLQQLICLIRPDKFFLLGMNCFDFQKDGMSTLCKTSNSLYTVILLNERAKL